ncbi:MAG: hypothetical protein IE933_10885 [Sphingomonadales bacterium]|nr:hypothetical protein [Sphingomonadales bacterium]MBD3774861.1 hypothetical protein [Paracoccaceae bacterium]
MTVHFAAARSPVCSPIAKALARKSCGKVANDNDGAGDDDRLLHAALRHFAEHGLGAAHQARKQAQAAFFAGDRQAYDWWLSICRTLDRRLANGLERETEEQSFPA